MTDDLIKNVKLNASKMALRKAKGDQIITATLESNIMSYVN